MPRWFSLSFQDCRSFRMMELIRFHDHAIMVMIGIIVLISYIMFYLIFSKAYYKNLSEGTIIETVWSIVPAFLLIILVLPSMKVLYLIEDVKNPSLRFKIVAHQWYWTYVSPLYKNFFFVNNDEVFRHYEFDSMIRQEEEVSPRLLICREELVVPLGIFSRLLISSTDVIHSFAVPSLGLKVDALPGRINQLFVKPERLGVFYGQCSEICGSNHSFMPIIIKVVTLENYDLYSKTLLLEIIEDKFGTGLNF